jgi:hypothetical protein
MLVRLNGGLGNQMFQYAFGRCVSRVRREDVLFYKVGLGPGCHRAYGLDVFNVRDVRFGGGGGPFFDESHLIFDPQVYKVPNGTNFRGCWQTEKYFEPEPDLIRRDFTLRNPVGEQTKRVADAIAAAPQSAFIHVRRTDYLGAGQAAFHGNMTWDYYAEAMQYVRERIADAKFFVFSDDPDGCRERFADCTIVDHNKMGFGDSPGHEHEDLWLMSLCRHAIFPNSSFGWWGAWLGDTQADRIVIAPKKWFGNAPVRYDDVVPERWVKMGEPGTVPAIKL